MTLRQKAEAAAWFGGEGHAVCSCGEKHGAALRGGGGCAEVVALEATAERAAEIVAKALVGARMKPLVV
jgi:hypothetical protein